MAICTKCEGKGSYTLLYSHNKCSSCGGSGQVADPIAKAAETPKNETLKVTPTGFGVTGVTTFTDTAGTLTFTTAATGGSIVLLGGSTSGTGSGGTITLSGGSNVATTGHPPVVEWAAARIGEYDARERSPGEDEGPGWLVGHIIPAVAPVSTAILADMMMMLEQSRGQPEAFVCSCRDFADVLKFGDAPMLKWEGHRAVYFGTPILRSPDVPPGYVAVVSKDRKMVLCTVCR